MNSLLVAKNQLTNVNTWYNGYLTTFNCQNNNISDLDLSFCESLERVYVDSNNLSTLVLDHSPNIVDFHAKSNPNLDCIQVVDSTYSTNHPDWDEDPQVVYSKDCGWFDIEENELSENFTISPNPCTYEINISTFNGQNSNCEILDLNGRIIFRIQLSNSITSISVDELMKGMYIIVVNDKSKRFSKI